MNKQYVSPKLQIYNIILADVVSISGDVVLDEGGHDGVGVGDL